MQSSQQTKSDSDLDINLKNPKEAPTDTVSSIVWIPSSGNNLIFATSDWASYIRIYNLDPETSTLTQKAYFDAHSPCLSVKWHQDGKTLFTGCTDGSVKSFDLGSGGCLDIGRHAGPVKGVHWISESNMLLTVSFDKTVRFWDPRQAKHVAGFQLDYKPFCSDVLFPYLAIGLSEAKCLIVNLQKAETELGSKANYLKSLLGPNTQLTSIRLFSDANLGFGIGGNDGRCHFSGLKIDQDGKLALKPRVDLQFYNLDVPVKRMYPVNALGFHPILGSDFIYVGNGEGEMYFVDHTKNEITAKFSFNGVPVTQAELDPSGTYLAYSLGYDWARGIGGYMSQPSKICVHQMKGKELTYQY